MLSINFYYRLLDYDEEQESVLKTRTRGVALIYSEDIYDLETLLLIDLHYSLELKLAVRRFRLYF